MATLAYDYPLLGIFWSLLLLYVVFVFIMALFHVLTDIFRSHDMSGAAKAGWLLFVIVLPIIGVVVYLIARGGTMAEHSAARHAARANVGFGTYGGERAHAAYDETEMRPYT